MESGRNNYRNKLNNQFFAGFTNKKNANCLNVMLLKN